ncbi:helix-turn-helix domain-containing protein [Arthrobacter sp. TMS1-12-1]
MPASAAAPARHVPPGRPMAHALPEDPQPHRAGPSRTPAIGAPAPGIADRALSVGEVMVACLPAAAVRTLQAHEPAGSRLQAVIPLSGPVVLGGRAGPLLALPRGALAVVQGDLRVGHDGDDAVMILLRLPAHVLTARGLRLQGGAPRTCPGGSLSVPLGEFAYALLRSAPGPRDATTSRAAERSLVELLVGALLESDSPRVDGTALRKLLRERAVGLVDRRFADPALRPAGIARELHVSLRHLQRSFEGSGTTLAMEIRRARSDCAALLLTAVTGQDRSDLSIALRCGFSSVDQLRAAFEGHFGVPMSCYRQPPVTGDLRASA